MPLFNRLKKWLVRQLANPPSDAASADITNSQEHSHQEAADLDSRVKSLKKHLEHCSDVIYHKFTAGPDVPCTLVYMKGMVDLKTVEQSILKELMSFDSAESANQFRILIFEYKQIPVAQQKIHFSVKDTVQDILDGNAVLLVDGEPRILSLTAVGYEKRAITEAPNESVIRGPRDAFVEDLDTNLTLLRRRLKSSSFKVDMMMLGTESHTQLAVAYLEGKARHEVVDEVKKRIKDIKVDAILGAGYVEELIEDHPYSPFPQMQYTERPDTVTASLLEGRVAILINGTPDVLLAPVTLFTLLQSAEDYYQRYIAATWIRWIRYLFLFVCFLLPSLYIAITTFHPDIIPERLLVTIASSREIVPFPTMVEAFMMEFIFEALREASLRIPKAIGQAVSIIGALIIGTAAVEAGIVSPFMVIIVSLTGIASFIIPHYDLGLAFRLIRFPIMILAATFGLFGVACGLIMLYLHLVELRSFGVPYMMPMTPIRPNDLKDVLVRAPWWAMKTRPSFTSIDLRRQRKVSRQWTRELDEPE
ncbi:spore gernimation protein GerA [Cohnella kolymensis]|uniref:Spore gernimation protein GerA n=1 Tax=Cohnella kolymensis TaxID=1590652 RepID=A0ABR5A6D9_9BACL|nr:spore germination protein [Cohnella kolymensis]KIL36589.1 spore gernimation protein GerA [Cohnella kolymensis]